MLATDDDSLAMRHLPLLILMLLGTACTDRMSPSDDRRGGRGELIAMSGGEGGARYACVTCHGARGEGNGFDAPRLAGMPAGYLQKQMEDYAAGLRAHELMRDVARFLDSDGRMQVARYYAALPPQALPPATMAVRQRLPAMPWRGRRGQRERAAVERAAGLLPGPAAAGLAGVQEAQ
jgi:cytochrome c553